MTVINFTATFDLFASADDGADAGSDADIVPLVGTVTFVPQLRDNKPLLATGFTPRKAGLRVRPFVGYLDTDGQLKASPGGSVGVRLWANDPVLNAENLYYAVKFNVATQAGQKVRVEGGTFEAPSTDTTVNLTDVLTATASHISGVVRQSGYAEDIIDAEEFAKDFLRDASDASTARTLLGVNLTDLDEVEWAATLSAFPGTGTVDVIYGAKDTGFLYRWTGSQYDKISNTVTTSEITNSGATGRAVVESPTGLTARAVIGAASNSWVVDEGYGVAYVVAD